MHLVGPKIGRSLSATPVIDARPPRRAASVDVPRPRTVERTQARFRRIGPHRKAVRADVQQEAAPVVAGPCRHAVGNRDACLRKADPQVADALCDGARCRVAAGRERAEHIRQVGRMHRACILRASIGRHVIEEVLINGASPFGGRGGDGARAGAGEQVARQEARRPQVVVPVLRIDQVAGLGPPSPKRAGRSR